MAKKLINKERIEEAKKLLMDVLIEEYGEKQIPKFINFELLTAKQAENRGIRPNQNTISSAFKYGKEFITLKVPMIIDDKGNK